MFDSFFRKKKKEVTEYLVALKLDESTVSACVFTLTDGKTSALGKAYEEFSGDWDFAINATDQSVSKAAGDVDLSLIKKAVFGFPPYYLENDKISKLILPNLKRLTSELELTPSGFVVVPEAINFLLEKRDGGPQTSILIGFSKNHITVSLFRGGKLIKQSISEATDRVAETVESILGTFTDIDIFPTRFILYGSSSLDNIHNQFINYSWQKNPKFLHFPKVETLDNDFCLEAVVEAAASELSSSLETVTAPVTESNQVVQMPASKVSAVEQIGDNKATYVNPEDLGFTTESTKVIEENASTAANISDSQIQPKKKFVLPSFSFKLPFGGKKEVKQESVSPVVGNHQIGEKPKPKWTNLSLLSGRSKLALVASVVLFLIMGSGYYVASYTMPKATVTLLVDPKVLGSQKEIGVNPDLLTPSDSTNEIPGQPLETEVSGSRTIATSGTKLVGEEAKGKVTIYNKTTEERVFDAKTTLKSGNLSFTTDEEVTVPGASESVDGLTYGKATVAITASKIGAEGNLGAQTEFTVEEFSNTSYTARNDEALSGGTSREVSVVSASDQQKLVSELHDELKNQAVSDLNSKLGEGEHLLEESLVGNITSRKFSNEVNSETKELSLTLTENFKGLVYKDDDFTSLMEKTLLSNIPDGYEFIPSETVLGVSDAVVDEKTSKVRFKADFEARLYPKVNSDKIKSDIKGISLEKLESYMKTVQYVVGYQANVDGPLSLFESNIPKKTENIEIKVEPRS